MARKLAARRQKEREEKLAQEQKQQQKQQQLQQLYEYQKKHVAACVPKNKRVKITSKTRFSFNTKLNLILDSRPNFHY